MLHKQLPAPQIGFKETDFDGGIKMLCRTLRGAEESWKEAHGRSSAWGFVWRRSGAGAEGFDGRQQQAQLAHKPPLTQEVLVGMAPNLTLGDGNDRKTHFCLTFS